MQYVLKMHFFTAEYLRINKKLHTESSLNYLHLLQYRGLDPKVQCETRPVGLVEGGGTELRTGSVKTVLHAHGPLKYGWRFNTQKLYCPKSYHPINCYTTRSMYYIQCDEVCGLWKWLDGFSRMMWAMHIKVFRVCDPECTLFSLCS